MANSTQTAVSDGTLAVLDISISYLDRAEITVFFDSVQQTIGGTWDWVGADLKRIAFTPAVPNTTVVLVKRTTDSSQLRHQFSGVGGNSGAAFTAQSLDEDLLQTLHIAQESQEGNISSDFFQDVNMHNFRIHNMADGTAPQDAATVAQLQQVIVGDLPIPLPVNQGGSGAIDAPSALVNFGGTVIGRALFVTPDAATARTTLGITFGTAAGNVVQLDGSARLPAVDGSLLTALPSDSLRQMVLDGPTDTSGYANWLSAGTGLAVSYTAGTTPVALSFSALTVEKLTTISSNLASAFGTLPAWNTAYLYVDRVSASSIVGANTLCPPQYGRVFDKGRGALLQMAGAVNSTTFLDDWGNTWAAQGGAKVQATQFVFGTGALGGGGTLNSLNGTTDMVRTTDIKTLGPLGWTMRGWVRPLTLPGSNTWNTFASATNAGDFGAMIFISNVSGTIRFGYALSANGSTNDIALGSTQGTSLPAINTNYYVELTYDALAGVYRLYVNGVQEQTTPSAFRVCNVTQARVGSLNSSGWGGLNGYVDKFEIAPYCDHPNGTTYSVPVAAPTINPAGKLVMWFDTARMACYTVTGASTSAGANPTLTRNDRLFVGEGDSNLTTMTAVRNYAYKGLYDNLQNPVAASGNSMFSVDHNLGYPPEFTQVAFMGRPQGANAPWTDNLQAWNTTYAYNSCGAYTRNKAGFSFNTNGVLMTISGGTTPSWANSASACFLACKVRRAF